MGIAKGVLAGLVAVILVPAVVVQLLAPTTEAPPESTAPGATSVPVVASAGSPAARTAAVAMKDIAYSPTMVTVAVGGKVTWTNHDTVPHTVTPVDKAQWGTSGSGDAPEAWLQPGQSWSWTFAKGGEYAYYCVPHSAKGSDGAWKGMTGMVHVGEAAAQGAVTTVTSATVLETVAPNPIAPPVSLPGPDGVVRLNLTTKEVVAKLADGVTYTFWTFDGTVPGPLLRVTEGDHVELSIHNDASSLHVHSIDLHAVTGPGGGATVTQTAPGATTVLRFTALNPGLFVYHCASAPIPSHIADGMYGLILVEAKGGLPKVDKEFYVVQSEWYTSLALGAKGDATLDATKLLDETPTYFTFNGRLGALTGNGSLHARVNDTIRIFFGVGSFVPSSVHLIGEVFDAAYLDGNGPATPNRQTIMVPAAGAVTLELRADYPGSYTLVDHTLTRSLDRGAVGSLVVEGAADPRIFEGTTTPGSGH